MLKPVLAFVLLAAGAMPALAQSQQPPTPEQIYQRTCANVLNFLPQHVSKQAVAAVPDDAHVVLHGVCNGVNITSFGNSIGLNKTIAANRALAHALARHGYHPDQVVGIRIDGDNVQLYVHRL